MPFVSVVIPTFNRADLLPQAIDSVLAQTRSDIEVLVVDDASTDDTAAVMQRYAGDPRVRYLPNASNSGIAKSRNRGIVESGAPFIALLDSDDVWLDPAKLATQLDVIEQTSDCALVGTDAALIDRAGRVIGAIRNCASDRMIRMMFFVKNQFVLSSVLIRRSALDEVGLVDEHVPRGTIEDYELWARLARRHRIVNVRRRMTGYRIHDGNISRRHHRAFLEAFRIMHDRYRNDFPMAWILRIKMWRETRAIRKLDAGEKQ